MRLPRSQARSRRRRRRRAGPSELPPGPIDTAAGKSAVPSESPTPKPPAALEGSLVVLAKLKELEFHSRANLERLAELTLTVEDELKQKQIVRPSRRGLLRAERLPDEAHGPDRDLQGRVRPHAG